MAKRTVFGPLAAAGVMAMIACGGSGDAGEGSGEASAESPASSATAQPASAPAPDTTGAALWAHLQGEGYQDSWEFWPGKGELYDGGEPHGMKLTMYVNAAALDALHGGAEQMPEGAIVVKENYMPDGTLAAITTMYKRAGYNPEHADWFFVKYLPDGTLDQAPNGMALEGRLPGCQGCHIARAGNDYLFSEVEM